MKRMEVVHRNMFVIALAMFMLNSLAEARLGYSVSSVNQSTGGCLSFAANLQVSQNNTNSNDDNNNNNDPSQYAQYGEDIKELTVEAAYVSLTALRVTIRDVPGQRWQVPQSIVPRVTSNCTLGTAAASSASDLAFNFTQQPFDFWITRRSTGEVLFDTRSSNLVYKDQYLELGTALPNKSTLFGLAESTRETFRIGGDNKQAEHVMWNSDIPSLAVNTQTYGSHPFYLDVRAGGTTHGVLLLNSNGMKIKYQASSLTYTVLGGILDLYFFAGPTPLSVVQQYTELVGRPAAQPYWAFGFHQCRWGYSNVSDVASVVSRYIENKIPLDVIWNDLDYMNNYRDFTLDPQNYPQATFGAFLSQLHASGRRWVPIVDPGIAVDENDASYKRGIEADIFIKEGNGSSNNYLGQVWPGPTYFPDFLNPKTHQWWQNEIQLFHETVPFDGLWIDMNEVSNFCGGITCRLPTQGTCPAVGAQTTCCLNCSSDNPSHWDNPPYKIIGNLGGKTAATSAVHYDGTLEYNAHNMYGMSEAIATHRALANVTGKRPFVLSRSTFVGAGAHTAHWTGDNGASFNDLRYSIGSILNFGLVGIPMVGADICGFTGNTNEELCARWIQLGAFYPFCRAHSTKTSIRQELYLWPSVATAARNALNLRYRLLPFFYTRMYEAHVAGSPIARPLFFAFPNDTQTLLVDKQLMIGESLLVSPVVDQGATTVDAYIPRGTWYSLNNLTDSIDSSGCTVTLQAPIDTVNVHVRDGSIVPMQDAALTTAEARKSSFSLIVALGAGPNASARGELFLDDGESSMDMSVAKNVSTFVAFSAVASCKTVQVRSEVTEGDFALSQGWRLTSITVLSPKSSPRPPVLQSANLSLPIGSNFQIQVPSA